MKYQKGQELRNANQKEPSLSGLVTNFNVANAQAHRNQLHSGTERPPQECLHRYLHILQANQTCAAATQSGEKQKALV